jgi:hypothetical protein
MSRGPEGQKLAASPMGIAQVQVTVPQFKTRSSVVGSKSGATVTTRDERVETPARPAKSHRHET